MSRWVVRWLPRPLPEMEKTVGVGEVLLVLLLPVLLECSGFTSDSSWHFGKEK